MAFIKRKIRLEINPGTPHIMQERKGKWGAVNDLVQQRDGRKGCLVEKGVKNEIELESA